MSIDHLHQHDGWHPLHCPLGSSSDIWEWCLESEVTIHAEHLPGTLMYGQTGSHAILLTPVTGCSGELSFFSWSRYGDLSPSTYSPRERMPSFRLIAAGTQILLCRPWMPSLSIPWRDHVSYVFLPFSLIMRCLAKICLEQATFVLVAPVWQNQLWYSFLLRSLVELPVLFPSV